MIRGRVVNVWRSPPNKIHLDVRKEDKKKTTITVGDFNPFFFANGQGNYENIYGKSLKKIDIGDYRRVEQEREKYEEHAQADIPYVRNFLVEQSIRDGIAVDSRGRTARVEDVSPAKVDVPLRICHLDIEVYPPTTNVRNPSSEVVSVGLYDTYSKNTSILIVGQGQNSDPDFLYCKNEEELLNKLIKFFDIVNPDLIVGWNVKNYDIKYLNNRMNRINMNYRIFTEALDLQKADRKMTKRSQYKLDYVVVDEGMKKKEELNDTLEVLKRYGEKGEVDTLAKYNKEDVMDVVELDSRNEYTKTYSARKKMIGLENYNKIFSRGVPIETMAMRMLKNEKKILSRQPTEEEVEQRKEEKERMKEKKETIGGRVSAPPVGKFENVAFFDWSRYYPTILKVFNISPETVDGESEELGIIPRMCDKLNEERDKVDELLKGEKPGTQRYEKLQLRKENVKTLVNAVSGYIGFEWGRLYSLDCYDKMTSRAREGLQVLDDTAEDLGYNTLYDDTDGSFVQCSLNEAGELREKLESSVIDYFKDAYGVDSSNMKLDFERFYDSILWQEKEGGVGAKKKYAGHVTWENGKKCDYFKIMGFECISIDAPEYVVRNQKKLLEKVLIENKEVVRDFAKELIENFKKSDIKDICDRTRIGKHLDDYSKGTPPHARGSLYSNMYLDEEFEKNDRPYILYVKSVENGPNTDVVAFNEELPECQVDWRQMRKKVLKQNFEIILDLVGINYEKLAMNSDGQQFLDDW